MRASPLTPRVRPPPPLLPRAAADARRAASPAEFAAAAVGCFFLAMLTEASGRDYGAVTEEGGIGCDHGAVAEEERAVAITAWPLNYGLPERRRLVCLTIARGRLCLDPGAHALAQGPPREPRRRRGRGCTAALARRRCRGARRRGRGARWRRAPRPRGRRRRAGADAHAVHDAGATHVRARRRRARARAAERSCRSKGVARRTARLGRVARTHSDLGHRGSLPRGGRESRTAFRQGVSSCGGLFHAGARCGAGRAAAIARSWWRQTVRRSVLSSPRARGGCHGRCSSATC